MPVPFALAVRLLYARISEFLSLWCCNQWAVSLLLFLHSCLATCSSAGPLYAFVVALRTVKFAFQQFHVLPTRCIFVWISEQTAIISLHNINWLVCITETVCVYCAVRTGCLTKIQVNIFQGVQWITNWFERIGSLRVQPVLRHLQGATGESYGDLTWQPHTASDLQFLYSYRLA
jgi:hypothetical protein